MRGLLQDALIAGYIDKTHAANGDYLPELLLNDKTRHKTVLQSIHYSLQNCDEFWLNVAFVTTSGLATIKQQLIELNRRQIRGKILVSQYLNFTQPEALKQLLLFDNLDVRISTLDNHHIKSYIFKKDRIVDLIIGSSNLTANALTINKEWNLKVCGAFESYIIHKTLSEFDLLFEQAHPVDQSFIDRYLLEYDKAKTPSEFHESEVPRLTTIAKITPNSMQIEALKNIEYLRQSGAKRAILISATGTGKTYLSAFDVLKFKPKKLLFVVHRRTIAKASLDSFSRVISDFKIKMGLFSGDEIGYNYDYYFATIQTIGRDEHLKKFTKDYFDYIIVDETHRSGGNTYQKLIQYFEPKFLLGMTATPERTDGFDIFNLFNYNIAYEIRLHRALKENLLSDFHYYGVSDLTVNGEMIEETSSFNYLSSNERIRHILTTIKLYGTDSGIIRGLVFCPANTVSQSNEIHFLCEKFNEFGFKSVVLTANNSEKERLSAIEKLESNGPEKLDYIFTVDLFNEGIDIPAVNQIVLLRPTQSSIIFVQQLGRGLRKHHSKEYLTVIDFIGNYSSNFLIPIALYGNDSYNKESIRKQLISGEQLLPGTSTINFEKQVKENILKSLNGSNFNSRKKSIEDYQYLKQKLGKIPMMCDFLTLGSRDPYNYVISDKSYYNFVIKQERTDIDFLTPSYSRILELFASEVNNGKRIIESITLGLLLHENTVTSELIKSTVLEQYGIHVKNNDIESIINHLNFGFSYKNQLRKLDIASLVIFENGIFKVSKDFETLLRNPVFKNFLEDSVNCALLQYQQSLSEYNYHDGFLINQRYSRKDVFRILNWSENPNPQNVGGYMRSPDKSNCPIFITYHKSESISETTNYHDHFISRDLLGWMSKSKRSLNSPDVIDIQNSQEKNMRLPLFVKRDDTEGTEFYFLGDLTVLPNETVQTTIGSDNASVVSFKFKINPPLDLAMFNYLTGKDG